LCLKEVLDYVFTNIRSEKENLLNELNICNNENNIITGADFDLMNVLLRTPWKILKLSLQLVERRDIVNYIETQTLITKGINSINNIFSYMVLLKNA